MYEREKTKLRDVFSSNWVKLSWFSTGLKLATSRMVLLELHPYLSRKIHRFTNVSITFCHQKISWLKMLISHVVTISELKMKT